MVVHLSRCQASRRGSEPTRLGRCWEVPGFGATEGVVLGCPLPLPHWHHWSSSIQSLTEPPSSAPGWDWGFPRNRPPNHPCPRPVVPPLLPPWGSWALSPLGDLECLLACWRDYFLFPLILRDTKSVTSELWPTKFPVQLDTLEAPKCSLLLALSPLLGIFTDNNHIFKRHGEGPSSLSSGNYIIIPLSSHMGDFAGPPLRDKGCKSMLYFATETHWVFSSYLRTQISTAATGCGEPCWALINPPLPGSWGDNST